MPWHSCLLIFVFLLPISIGFMPTLDASYHTPSSLSPRTQTSFEDLPSTYILTDEYPASLSMRFVLQQGACGSCWTFSAACAIADRIFLRSGGKINVFVSPTWPFACDHSCRKNDTSEDCNQGCDGGFPDLAFDYMAEHGVVDFSCLPWDASQTVCPDRCVDGTPIVKRKWLTGYHYVYGEEAIMREVLANGTVIAPIIAYPLFSAHRTEFFNCTLAREKSEGYWGLHLVQIVGWSEYQGVPTWKIRNTFGEGWGHGGFASLERGINACGLEEGFYTALHAFVIAPLCADVQLDELPGSHPGLLYASIIGGSVLASTIFVVAALCIVIRRRRRAKYLSIPGGEVVSIQGDSSLEYYEDIGDSSIIKWDELKIIRSVGHGGFAEVFLADWKGTHVAVKKFFLSSADPIAMRIFRDEVALMRNLRHPNVVQFIGFSLHPPFMVTSFLPRGSLMNILRDREKVKYEWGRVRKWALDAARGLNYLHTHSPPIIHRDVKSPNLLVDADWSIKVADFGVSRLSAGDSTMTKTGTPQWTAPEVIETGHYSEKADVFSYGVTLWEMVTRAEPYAHIPNSLMIPLRVIAGERPPLPGDPSFASFAGSAISVPDAFLHLIRSCWQVDPQLRPQMSDIVKTLQGLESKFEKKSQSEAPS